MTSDQIYRERDTVRERRGGGGAWQQRCSLMPIKETGERSGPEMKKRSFLLQQNSHTRSPTNLCNKNQYLREEKLTLPLN